MNLTSFSLKNPFAVIALVLVVAALGTFAFFKTPTDLFPDTQPPQVVVVTVRPGSDAQDMADKITQVIEKELNTLGGLKRVTSVSRDEVSSVVAEFEYSKAIGEAVLDVQNAIGRVRAQLPKDILEPRIFRITDATRPLATIALSPREGSPKTLADIRLLADNQITDELLALPGIADVDVFGGHQPEVRVLVDRDKLSANHVSINEVIGVLAQQNVSAPSGTIYSGSSEFLVKVKGEFGELEHLRGLALRQSQQGFLRLGDVARIELGEAEQRSLYHGNGEPAIAVNVMRPDNGPTVAAIHTFKDALGRLEVEYPDIRFQVTDDQEPIINLNVTGMRESLIQAVLLTVLIVLLFLADLRAALVVSVSIPLAFMASLAVLWFSPYTLNMVTLSGLIISVGMVVDASIVVLENIYRHIKEQPELGARGAALVGAREVGLAVTAGMFTTVIVLIPVMFSGGYSQQVMRPLNLMTSSTLVASLLIALTVIPLMASKLLSRKKAKPNPVERMLGVTDKGVGLLSRLYLGILGVALRWRVVVLVIAGAFFVLTVKNVKPLIGGELMPRMDTGIVILNFDTQSDASPTEVERILNEVEDVVYSQPGVEMVSSVVGSEPGQISFGGGGSTAQSGHLTIHLVDRMHRDETIWQIQDKWRDALSRLAGVRTFQINEFGATPLSTTRAPLDVIISGPDPEVISQLADESLEVIRGLPGLVDVRRSWYFDKTQFQVRVDPDLARFYQTSPGAVASELKAEVKGIPATAMRLAGLLDIPIRVRYAEEGISSPEALPRSYVATRFGPTPLRALASLENMKDQPFVTRERLKDTIDITAINRVLTIGQVTPKVASALKAVAVPAGYSIQVAGSAADMKTGQAEMGHALLIGFVLLYILLVAMFHSFLHPVTIMSAIPLAVAGALWGLLLFDKPMCKPATMGLILLGGTIVNNSILLLDFILAARKEGVPKNEAILGAVRLRIRPILMTTVSTVVGLMPLVLESAVGLERMSPLGIVASVGLIVGTFLTMVVVPVVYSGLDTIKVGLGRFIRWCWGAPPPESSAETLQP